MIVGLVLAGGRATRLGRVDKPLLTLGTGTLIEHLLARLSPQVERVAISANGEPARFAHLGREVLADELTGRGPLAGVLRGLAWARAAGAAALLTVPGDTPFIPPDLARRLSPAPGWALSEAGLHPLVALWPTGCAVELQDWLDGQPSGRVRNFGRSIGMRDEMFAETPDPFHNVNTPEDLAACRARV